MKHSFRKIKLPKRSLFVFLAALTLIACDKLGQKEPDLLEVSTGEISEITISECYATGSLDAIPGSGVDAFGFCVSERSNPDLGDMVFNVTSAASEGVFSKAITSLQPATVYYIRAYAEAGSQVVYGSEKNFRTLDLPVGLPVLSTIDITAITETTALSGGVITDDGGAPVILRGLCWSTSQLPTYDDFFINAGSGTGNFKVEMEGLDCEVTYYVRAYAQNEVGFAYGEQKIFTTAECPANLPTVTTSAVTDIGISSATSGGNVSDDGGSPIIERGICWNGTGSPTTYDDVFVAGSGSGAFAGEMTELEPGTSYFVRAYAINDAGTAYGSTEVFTTLEGTVKDIDGNVYETVQIGDKLWMKENLKSTRYADGTYLEYVEGNSEWSSMAPDTRAYCWYENDGANEAEYGLLYSWAGAMKGAGGSNGVPSGIQGVCPVGWHIPSHAEWMEMQEFLIENGYNWDGTNAGNKIGKALASTYGWNESPAVGQPGFNQETNNSSGFTALPGGYRSYNGSFAYIGNSGVFWTSTEEEGNVWRYRVNHDRDYLDGGAYSAINGFSVRCVKD